MNKYIFILLLLSSCCLPAQTKTKPQFVGKGFVLPDDVATEIIDQQHREMMHERRKR